MITSTKLEELAEKYEIEDFIKDDPIQFPHRFMPICNPEQSEGSKNKDSSGCTFRMTETDLRNIEIAAFVSSLFAYGNRKVFVKKLMALFDIMQNKPLEYVLSFDSKTLKGFNYRFAKDIDVIEVFLILNKLYKKDGGLKALFEYGYSNSSNVMLNLIQHRKDERNCDHEIDSVRHNPIRIMFQSVVDYFYSNVQNIVGQGFYHLIPNPQNGGAMKRMNMFMRWMVRKSPVDLGVWDFIPTGELLIPLDVHVARVSREMGLLKRNSNDFQAVLELTENLKKLSPNDPVKFDFAMFGLGINS